MFGGVLRMGTLEAQNLFRFSGEATLVLEESTFVLIMLPPLSAEDLTLIFPPFCTCFDSASGSRASSTEMNFTSVNI